MMKTKAIMKLAAALSIGSASLLTATPAMADRGWGGYESGRYDRGYDDGRYYRGDRYNGRYRDGQYYRGASYPAYRNDYRNYRGNRCRDNGTGGAIIGAIAGGLLGNEIAGRGNRATGTVVGGALGAVTGHLIDKSDGRRC